MASQLGLPLVPDTSYYYPRFYLGLPEGESLKVKLSNNLLVAVLQAMLAVCRGIKMELWHTWIIHR